MITFHPDFKESTKNLFLSLSNFVSTNILMYEHLSNNSPVERLPSENALVTFLNMKLEEVIVGVDEMYTSFHEEIFALLGNELNPIYQEEDGTDSQLKVLGVTPLIPRNLEKVAEDFQEELLLLKRQYESILSKKYENLNDDSLFNEKLQEFCSIVKPDNQFFQDIRKKELSLFEEKKDNSENAATLEK